jgi:hypothetical protein
VQSLTSFPTHARQGAITPFPFITGKTLYDIETIMLQSPTVLSSKSPRKTTADVCSLVLRYCLCRAYVDNFGRGHLDNKSMEVWK